MHTEHLQNVRIVWVVAGWLVAAAVTSLIVLVFEAAGIGTTPDIANAAATAIAVAIGFGTGGFFASFRSLQAPILHGAGIGITSVVVWALVNAMGALLPGAIYRGVGPAVVAGLMLVQFAAAIIGALLGYNVALRGKPGLSDEAPEE